ncbi:MAG: B3/4 domain-containing protein [Paenisporosarcina sp.]
MKLSIDPSILIIDENIKLGINHYTKFVVSDSPQMLKGRMQLFQEHLFFDLQDKKITDYEGIREWRAQWKMFGADSNRYLPTTEALMSRIQTQDYLQPVNSGVDLNNFFSLQYEIPIGLYDVSSIVGDIKVQMVNNQTSYLGINGSLHTLKGLITLSDHLGPFGSPFVDSARTAVHEHTLEALQVFFFKSSMTNEEAELLLTSSGKMFNQVNGGDCSSHIVDKQQIQTVIK